MTDARRVPILAGATGVFVVLLGTVTVPLDSAVNVDFPRITQHFGLPIPFIQWVVISYTLTSASLMLVFGRAGDMLGHRRVFLAGTGWSSAAFVLCASAPSYGWLLAARVAQGFGAGMVMSCGPALVTTLYPEHQRARALGAYTMTFGIGGALGPLLAGVLIGRFGWSAVFWFRAPIAALAFAVALGLPTPPARGTGQRFDAVGASLLALATCLMLLALNQLRSPAWAAGFAVAAGLCTAGFIRREQRCPQPIIDIRLFRDPDFSLINLSNILLNLAGFAVLLLAPFALARVPGLAEWKIGAVLAASPVGTMLAAPLCGRLAERVPALWLMLAGALMIAGGLFAIGALATAGLARTLPGLACAMFVQGAGQGLFQVTYLDAVTGALPARERGIAGSLGMLTRTFGLVTGATVLMLAFQASRAFQAAHGLSESAAFLAGLRMTFQGAAIIPLILALAWMLRSRVRARNT